MPHPPRRIRPFASELLEFEGAPASRQDIEDVVLGTGFGGRRSPVDRYLEAGGDLESLKGVMRFGSRANRTAVPTVWRRNFQGGTSDALRSVGPSGRRRLYDQFKVIPYRRVDIEKFLRGPSPIPQRRTIAQVAAELRPPLSDLRREKLPSLVTRPIWGTVGEVAEQTIRDVATRAGFPGVERLPETRAEVVGSIISEAIVPSGEIGAVEAAAILAGAPGTGLIFNLRRLNLAVDAAQALAAAKAAGRGGSGVLQSVARGLEPLGTGIVPKVNRAELLRKIHPRGRRPGVDPPKAPKPTGKKAAPSDPKVTFPETTKQAAQRARGEGGLREATSPAGPTPEEVRSMSVRARLQATQANDKVNTIATGARDKGPTEVPAALEHIQVEKGFVQGVPRQGIPTKPRILKRPVQQDLTKPRVVKPVITGGRVPGLPRQVATADQSFPSGVYRGGGPPSKAGGASVRPNRNVPRFKRVTEDLLDQSLDTGIDRVLYEGAIDSSRLAIPRRGVVSRLFNPLRGLIDQAANRNADVQVVYKATQNYVSAQAIRSEATVTGLTGAIEQAFGKGAVQGEKVITDLFIGELTGGPIDDMVGTVFHALEDASQYSLNPLQKRLVKKWSGILDTELAFSKDVGLNVGQIEGVWVAHSFVNPDKAAKAITKAGKAGFQKKRNIPTLEEFVKFAADHNSKQEELGKGGLRLVVETDLEKILSNRLFGANNARGNLVFAEELAERTGGVAVVEGVAAKFPDSQLVRAGGKEWAFPTEIAEDIRKLQQIAVEAQGAETMAVQAIDTMRAALLNLDFSIGFGRQGFLAFMNDPVAAIKGWASATAIVTSKEGWATWYVTNARRAEAWAQAGLQLRGGPYSIKLARVGESATIVEKIPGLGWLSRFQGETIMPILKINSADSALATLQAVRDGRGLQGVLRKIPFYDDIMKKVNNNLVGRTDHELMEIVADGINNHLGGLNWAEIGNRAGAARKFFLLTEGWTRAQVGLFINAAKMDPKGILARQLLIRELKMATVLSTSISLITTGKLPEYDPRSGRFLDVLTPFGRVGIMPHKTIMRTIIRAMVGKPSDEFGPDSLIRQRVEAGYGFFEGRLGQIPRLLADFTSGTDYQGGVIENKWAYLGEQMSPIIIQQLISDLTAGAPVKDLLGRAGAEFLGFGTQPYSLNDQRSDLVASMNIDSAGNVVGDDSDARVTDFRELDPVVQGALKQTDAFRAMLDPGGRQTKYESRVELENTKIDEQLERDDLFLSRDPRMNADNWRTALYDEQKAAAGRREIVDLLESYTHREPTEPNDIALNDYYEISGSFGEGATFDKIGRRNAIDDYLGNLPNEQRDFVLKNIHPNATPLARRYYDMLQSRRDLGWYDLHEQIVNDDGINLWDYLSQSDVERGLAEGSSQERYLAMRDANTRGGRAGVTAYVSTAIPADQRERAETVFSRINTEVREGRQALRLQNPTLDADHVLFNDVGPMTVYAMAEMVRLEAGKNELQWLVQRRGVKVGVDILHKLAVAGIETFAKLADATENEAGIDDLAKRSGIPRGWVVYIGNQANKVSSLLQEPA